MYRAQRPASDDTCNSPVKSTLSPVDGVSTQHAMPDRDAVDPRQPRYVPPTPGYLIGLDHPQPNFEDTSVSYELANPAQTTRRARRSRYLSEESCQSTAGLCSGQDLNSLGTEMNHLSPKRYERNDLLRPESDSCAGTVSLRAQKDTATGNELFDTYGSQMSQPQSPDQNITFLRSMTSCLGQGQPTQSTSLSAPQTQATRLYREATICLQDEFAKLDISQPTTIDDSNEPADSNSETSWDEVHEEDAACIEVLSDCSMESDPYVPTDALLRQGILLSTGHAPRLSHPESEANVYVRTCPAYNRTGGQAGKGFSACRSGGSGLRRGSSPDRRAAKRRMSDGPNDDEDDSDQPDEYRSRPSTAEDGDKTKRSLACPYTKANPDQNFLQAQCPGLWLTDIKAVKQHLKRQHKRPDYYCQRCSKEFETGDEATKHARAPEGCQVSEDKFAEKMTQDQWDKVHKKRPREGLMEGWYAIFEILFPDKCRPSSPYRDNPHSLAVEHVSRIMTLFGPEAFYTTCQSRQRDGHQIDATTQIILKEAYQAIGLKCVDEFFDFERYQKDC